MPTTTESPPEGQDADRPPGPDPGRPAAPSAYDAHRIAWVTASLAEGDLHGAQRAVNAMRRPDLQREQQARIDAWVAP